MSFEWGRQTKPSLTKTSYKTSKFSFYVKYPHWHLNNMKFHFKFTIHITTNKIFINPTNTVATAVCINARNLATFYCCMINWLIMLIYSHLPFFFSLLFHIEITNRFLLSTYAFGIGTFVLYLQWPLQSNNTS